MTRILVDTARTRGSRVTPVADLADDGGPTVDPARFRGPEDRWHRHRTPAGEPRPWDGDPALGALRAEVREVLDLTPEDQRVLLHRGRARVRAELEAHHRGDQDTG